MQTPACGAPQVPHIQSQNSLSSQSTHPDRPPSRPPGSNAPPPPVVPVAPSPVPPAPPVPAVPAVGLLVLGSPSQATAPSNISVAAHPEMKKAVRAGTSSSYQAGDQAAAGRALQEPVGSVIWRCSLVPGLSPPPHHPSEPPTGDKKKRWDFHRFSVGAVRFELTTP